MNDEEFELLLHDLLQDQIEFEDDTFPADSSSIGKDDGDIEWLRPKQICSPDGVAPVFMDESGTSVDLVQGKLGNCAVVAAAACITQHPELFQKIVPPNQGFDDSVYAGIFRFRFWQYDEWHTVTVDDRLPTRDGKLVHIRSENGNVFWGALLEKAYAKLYGSYAALRGESVAVALTYFTGKMVEFYNLSPSSDQNVPNLPNRLSESFAKNSIAIASTVNEEEEIGKKYDNGIIANHAYSVIAIEAGDSPEEESFVFRLRDPLGSANVSFEDQTDGANEEPETTNGEFWYKRFHASGPIYTYGSVPCIVHQYLHGTVLPPIYN